jgi:hypothetical protein
LRSFVFANVNVGTTRKTSIVRREMAQRTTPAGMSLFNVEWATAMKMPLKRILETVMEETPSSGRTMAMIQEEISWK